MRNDQEHENEQAVIEGPNPEATASVEIVEVGFGLLGVQQNSGDQEAGKHKEEVYTHPSIGGDCFQVQRRKGIGIVN
jgi:hypothetical protein